MEIIENAISKLDNELSQNSKNGYAEPIIEYLKKRCSEAESMAQDVMQEHKAFDKCFKYIIGKAKECSSGGCACVKDEVVYEWAEDYYHLDDKEIEEEKAKKAEEINKKAEERKKKAAEKKKEEPKAEVKKEEPNKQKAVKKDNDNLDGQMDIFSFI